MVLRLIICALLTFAATAAATPVSAQFFLSNPKLAGAPMRGDESDIGYALPNATDAELRAGLVWSMRAALNVAALQCQFEPTLLSVENYNAILKDHKDELASSLTTLNKYFTRTSKSKAAGQSALDHFSTRVYSNFSTVSAQYVFCLTAASIATDAIFSKRGTLGDIAQLRMRELRNSLKPHGEQQFPGRTPMSEVSIPGLDRDCLNSKGRWDTKKCGKRDS